MNEHFKQDPAALARFNSVQAMLDDYLKSNKNPVRGTNNFATVNIPVVVHILLPAAQQALVTDAIVQTQIDTLNYFYGNQTAGDSLRTYPPFRTSYGRSTIGFCLAQRKPDGTATNGIDRIVYTGTYTATGGTHPGTVVVWDPLKYMNIWVVIFTDNTLGFSYTPGSWAPSNYHNGFVNDYRAFGSGPGTSAGGFHFNEYNGGKTAVHEIGHFFNLLHPWGPNNSSNPTCTLSDGCSDTPPTNGPFFGCTAGPVYNSCSPTAPGVMWQNHMDYADDACMTLFTVEQCARINASLTSPDRIGLTTSNSCSPPVPVSDFAFGTSTATTVACPATSPTVTIPTTVTGTFVTPIVLTATAGVPAGTTVTFAPNPLTPGSSTVATLNNANTLNAGTYTITVTGTAGTTIHTTTITYIISAGTPPVITTQPASQPVCAPATATFTVASSTAGVSYKWQSATAAAPTVFTDIAGATNASYTTGASTGLNGTVYHAIVYTQCATVTSANAVLTVNTAAAITTQPTDKSACTGVTATFTVAATGTGVTYQWQSSATLAGTYTNVAVGTGANSNSYTTAPLTVTTDRYYRVIVATTLCPASIPSNVATLTTSVTTAINTQPTAQVVCAPAAATFTVAAVGTGANYQWQVATAAAPTTFSNVTTGTGGTTNSYNTGATTGAMNGNIYHVVVTGSCNTVTSSDVTLTVNTAPVITTAPAAVVICSGNPTAFTVVATGTGLNYQWQSATALAGPYNNIGGAIAATYAIASTTAAMNGTYYQVIITGTCTPAVTSVPVLLTVNSPVAITTQPVDASICYVSSISNDTAFSVAATGTAVTYQWQISTDGGSTYNNVSNVAPYSGATTNKLKLTGVALTMTGYKYRVLVSGTCTPAGTLSNVVTLTVLNPVVINADPVAVKTCTGNTATFTVNASGSQLTYKWQFSKDGINWGFVSNTAPFSGANTATLTITNVTTALNGYQYRAEVIGTPCGDKFTAGALLTVNDNPSVALTVASRSSLTPSTPATLYTTVSPVANYTYAYKRNGVAVNFTTASVPLTIDWFGTYQVTVTNTATGCSATSNIVTVKDSASSTLFIYPNPNKGVFQVRYYNAGGTTTSRTLNVFDDKGVKVYSKVYPTTAIYERMDVNIANYSAGLYFIELRGSDGKLIATGKAKKD